MTIRIKAGDSLGLPLEVQSALKNLGRNIQLSRKRREMTQGDLSRAMFVTRQTVARLEKGDPSVAWSTFLLAIFCLRREKELTAFLAQENDRLGMLLDLRKLDKQKKIRRKKADDLDF